jgi:hypothetical protein
VQLHRGTTADRALGADAVFSGRLADREVVGQTALHVFAVREDDRLVADLCGGTTVWTPQAASEVQVLTGVSAPEPGSAGTELPGGPSDTALEAVVAVLLVAAFAGGLVLRRRAGG